MLSANLPDHTEVTQVPYIPKVGMGSLVSAILILHKRWGIPPHTVVDSPSIGKVSEFREAAKISTQTPIKIPTATAIHAGVGCCNNLSFFTATALTHVYWGVALSWKGMHFGANLFCDCLLEYGKGKVPVLRFRVQWKRYPSNDSYVDDACDDPVLSLLNRAVS